MKILAFNGSPRMEKGITDSILQTFLEGARSAGAEPETIYISKQKIKYCTGCFNCWFVHPGKCIHKDDMAMIREKIKGADVLVFGSPVYFDGFTAQMKTLLDRLIPGGMPFIENRDGHSRHPSRGKELKTRKMLLVSTCGFGEVGNFDPIIHHMKAIAANFASGQYMGALVRPMGGTLEMLKEEKPAEVKAIFDAFRQAGVEAATKGMISEDLQTAVAKPLISVGEFVNRANTLFSQLIDENKK
ncbi:MAG: flavodoxin family protein [Proteobacteria bacterium]|nr:flavodoxin family protein [Pseudomonadota bacterium]MBU4469223.1 flavodoxin family protein [Pseudomonadota bacterium]MCG2752254.1 flavodoxin family protein [Desulfobacteraceae bacterium]